MSRAPMLAACVTWIGLARAAPIAPAHAEDDPIDDPTGEVIVVEGTAPPAVLARPKNHVPSKAPPYSDRAILSDAWTRAWMLLEIDEVGRVTRFKFLKRPGYDLERIAMREVVKLRFDPARDGRGRAMRTQIVWSIEWPSAGWLEQLVGTYSAMPPLRGFPPRRLDHYVPCAGSGPWAMDSVHKTYRDCSRPDLSKAAREPWVMAAAVR
jgi:hypothetical protein